MAHGSSVEAPHAAIVILLSQASCLLVLSSLDTQVIDLLDLHLERVPTQSMSMGECGVEPDGQLPLRAFDVIGVPRSAEYASQRFHSWGISPIVIEQRRLVRAHGRLSYVTSSASPQIRTTPCVIRRYFA
jgi:hypothetical protein